MKYKNVIDDFVSDQFVILINETQRWRMSKSAIKSGDAVNQAEPSVDRNRRLEPVQKREICVFEGKFVCW